MHFFDTILPLALVALSTADAAAIIKAPRSDNNLVPNSYIVVMKANTSDDKFESHRSWVSNKLSASDSGVTNGGVRRDYNFDSQFKAYSGVFGDDVIKQISDDKDVAYIEQNSVVTLDTLRMQLGPPSWGLGRISQTTPGPGPYVYDDAAGGGITAYIVDSGVDVKHPDFDDRATWGTNTVDSLDEDCGNHGTHVAGTIGGNRHGVAKKVKLVAIKVFGCDVRGSIQDIVEGMVWAVHHAQEHGDPNKSVMNLSLGAPYSRAFNDVAAAVVRMGFFVAVSAGNEHIDASQRSPASEPIACTIGASDAGDKIADFSNFGSGVDLFAPGVDIISTLPGGKTGAMSGTSMAAPHVAGFAALLMVRENLNGPVVCDRIKALATDSVHGAPAGTTSKLLNNGIRRKFSTSKRPS